MCVGAVDLTGEGSDRTVDVGRTARDIPPRCAAQGQRTGDLCRKLLADPGVFLGSAGRGVRIGVEPLVANERYAGEQGVVQHRLERIGGADVAVELQHPCVPLRGRDCSARLGVRAGERQLVGLAYRLCGPPSADRAGDVGGGRDQIGPPPPDRVDARLVTSLDRHIGQPGREIQRTHRVPPQPIPARPRHLVAEERRQVEIPRRAGLAIQLDQCHLDDGMAISLVAAVRAEDASHQICAPHGCVQ